MKICRGFTLLELMVTVAVAAILTTVAVPGFRDLVQNNRVTSQTNELVAALTMARTEAIKRGRAVEVTVVQVDPGWRATVSLVGADASVPPLRAIDRQGSSVTINAANVVFSPSGAPTASGVFEIQPKGGCTGQKRRQVTIGFSGQITTERQDCT